MNKNKLKSYAPAARKEFIQAVKQQAYLLGFSENHIEPAEVRGDLLLINGRAFPKTIAEQHNRLKERLEREGFNQLVEEVAYTWFNRFTALRYMEIHGYLDHGVRVLSHPNNGNIPELLEQAARVELKGINRDEVIEMKLAGTKDAELYRKLLIAQCNALNDAMPFLFERINDETELLLPDNLLHSNSVIRKMVTEIDEDDWQEVEIIGWLYQFYISEKKDEVIGKVVKSEDIPAATQLFTPNWIVKYMVQNSLGRMWLATYPDSIIRSKMEYYIEPAEQTEEVKAQLAIITPSSLNPEEITILDPACGSGHILVEAYELIKEIYLERGYRLRDVPKLILEKNLYGLDIDDRAAQLACFALLMKARADDRRILDGNIPNLNVLAIQESAGIDAKEIAAALLPEKKTRVVGNTMLFAEMETQQVIEVVEPGRVSHSEVIALLNLFEYGKTFGSLIKIDEKMVATIERISSLVDEIIESRDLFSLQAAITLKPFVKQAQLLGKRYDCVIANPPYMSNQYLTPILKTHLKNLFKDTEKDTFAAFIARNLLLTKRNGYLGFVMPFVWMFISSFEEIRQEVLTETTVTSLIQLEYNAFEPACVPVCTFILHYTSLSRFKGNFIKLSDFKGHQNQAPKTLEAINNPTCRYRYQASASDFKKLPSFPIAYWVSDKVREIFEKGRSLGEIAEPKQGLATADNDRFLRLWYEVNLEKIGFNYPNAEFALKSGKKWFPYNKGGEFRKWYGNQEYTVNWEKSGQELKSFKPKAVIRNENYYFKPSVTWSRISSSYFGVRRSDKGFIFDTGGPASFPNIDIINIITGYLCTKLTFENMQVMNPTLNFQVGNVASLPVLESEFTRIKPHVDPIVEECVSIARQDWDSFETSWDFQQFPLLNARLKAITVEKSFLNWQAHCTAQIKRMQELETENNRLFIDAYGLQDEMSPEVPEEQITLARANREQDIERLISYAVGCMMGRYSLDVAGLVYAQSGNEGFDSSKYKTFAADEDSIIPVMDQEWFSDDATNRFIEFIRVAWPESSLEENLKYVAESLSPKQGETSRETIRRYFSYQFYKDHIQTYKKRPIYWLFSSGKQKAFECLVYLHRYNESTLSRMRNEYVIPLHTKLAGRIDFINNEKESAKSSASRNKLQKELDSLKKKQTELSAFDDLLRHYADQKIKLDLDDGVRVNYGKFGALLAESKTIAAESE